MTTFRSLSTIVGIMSVAACTTELTPAAEAVRQIPATIDTPCQFLGSVTGAEALGMTTAEDAQSALNQVRNEVAAKGGNAFILTNAATTFDSSVAQADAYLCP